MKNSLVIEQIHLSDKPLKYDVHSHNSYQIVFVINGRMRIMLGRDRIYEAGPDSLIFISNLEEHSTLVLEEPYKRYYMILLPLALDRIIKNPHLLSVFKNRPSSFCNVLDICAISNKVENIFTSLYAEVKKPEKFSAEMVDCLLRELIITVYRNNFADFPSPSESIPSQIYEIQKYIDNHFSQAISLRDLAKQNYISVSYMSNSFKKMTGYSPMQYLQLNRLSYSKVLLASTDLTISEIAYRSGFIDVNNYIRKFKAFYGYTPGSVRKHKKN